MELRASIRWWRLLAVADAAGAALRLVVWELIAWRERPALPADRPVAVGSGILAGLAVLVTVGLFALWTFGAPALVRDYAAVDRRSQAIEISDSAGRWLGVLPEAFARSSPGSGPDWPRHRTLQVEQIPQGWLDVLVALEDRHVRSWRSWNGLDLLALVRSAALAPFGLSDRGGSSLTMQLVRSMRHLSPGADESFGDRISRKLIEMLDAPALYQELGGIDDFRFQRLLTRHLPLVQGTRGSRLGGSIYGIGLAARILFDKQPEALDLAEQAVLAAAVWRHVIVAEENDPAAVRLRDLRWDAIRDRARRGLRMAYGPGNALVAPALAKLASMSPPRPRMDPALMALLPPESEGRVGLIAGPEQRAAYFLRGELVTAADELSRLLSPEELEAVTGLDLTLDAAENFRFKKAVELKLVEVAARLGPKLELPLLPGAGPTAELLLLRVDNAGRIRRHYSNRPYPLVGGGARPIGSLGKAAAAVLLGTEDSSAGRYCNLRVTDGSIHNANGDRGVADCGEPGAYRSMHEVFAHSLNLPLIWRLGQISNRSLTELADRAHLELVDGVPPAVQLALGLASSRPDRLVALVQAIGNGAAGKAALGPKPFIVASWHAAGRTGRQMRTVQQSEWATDLRPYFEHAGTRTFVLEALSAPLSRGGTLSSLGQIVSPNGLHLAKTGTTTTELGATRDKWVMGTIATDRGMEAYLLRLGAVTQDHPLGRGISANQLVPLLKDLVAPQMEYSAPETVARVLPGGETNTHDEGAASR